MIHIKIEKLVLDHTSDYIAEKSRVANTSELRI